MGVQARLLKWIRLQKQLMTLRVLQTIIKWIQRSLNMILILDGTARDFTEQSGIVEFHKELLITQTKIVQSILTMILAHLKTQYR